MSEALEAYSHPGIFPLTDSPWDKLSSASLARLTRAAAVIDMRRGDITAHGLGIMLSGALADQRELSNGRRVISALFRKGDFVDLRRRERARQGQLVALKRSQFLALDPDQLDWCLHHNPEIATAVLVQTREQFARALDHASDVVSKTPIEKFTSLLFEFRRWPETTPSDREKNIVAIPIPRSDIADYIGVKPETVSRVVKQLEQERLIEIPEQNQVQLVDVPSMRQLANGGRPRQSTRRP